VTVPASHSTSWWACSRSTGTETSKTARPDAIQAGGQLPLSSERAAKPVRIADHDLSAQREAGAGIGPPTVR
jgi:hypothetical protein